MDFKLNCANGQCSTLSIHAIWMLWGIIGQCSDYNRNLIKFKHISRKSLGIYNRKYLPISRSVEARRSNCEKCTVPRLQLIVGKDCITQRKRDPVSFKPDCVEGLVLSLKDGGARRRSIPASDCSRELTAFQCWVSLHISYNITHVKADMFHLMFL